MQIVSVAIYHFNATWPWSQKVFLSLGGGTELGVSRPPPFHHSGLLPEVKKIMYCQWVAAGRSSFSLNFSILAPLIWAEVKSKLKIHLPEEGKCTKQVYCQAWLSVFTFSV